MSVELPISTVDVFGGAPFLGNPVAVIHDADDLTHDEMATIARWTNLSETTFLLSPTDPAADYRVRIFTPSVELPFAGHPTLGSAHAWISSGGVPAGDHHIVQQCGIGRIELRRSEGELAFAAPELLRSGPVDDDDFRAVCTALGLTADQVLAAQWIDNGPGWIGVLVADVETLRSLTPSDSDLKLGVTALTPDEDTALEVRAFFSADGRVDEDPVTGSLNAGLALWLVGTGRLDTPYVASQGREMRRRGRVSVTASGADLWIGGSTTTLVSGRLRVR